AIEEEAFYANLELLAKATKTASKVGLFIGGTMITAGLSTAAAGYLTLGEGVGVVVSGLDVVLDVSSTASTIIVGENGKLTMTLEEMKDDYAPVSAIFGLPDLGGLDYGNKLFYVGEQIIDFVYEDKILGIKISNDSEDGNIDYVQIPLKDGKIPKEFFESDILDEAFMKEYQELFSDIIYEMDYENDEDIYSDFNDLTYEDIDNMLEQLDMSIEEFDMIYDELIKEIEEIENRPIDGILDEIEKELLEEDESIEEEQDIDNDDNDNNNDDDNNDEDYDEKEDPEDPEDPEDLDNPEDPNDEVYYTLTVYYVLEFDDEDVILPPTFEKKDYKYGDKYNIPVPKIEGYTPDKDTVEGTIGMDETVIVSYMKDYEPYKVLLIEYVIDDEKVEAPEPYIDGDIKIGQEYNIPSPTVEGYYTDNPVVSGIMEEGLNQVIVTYYNNDKYYTVTIRYVFADEDGNELGEAKATETREVKVGDSYTIIAPEIDGYYPDLEKYTAIMGDVGNMNYTIKYREANTTEYVISGLVDLDIIKIPEGKSLEEALAYLPEKVPVYINAGNNIIEIDLVWKENSERIYPTVDEVIGKYPYTGSYEFQGEFNLPENVINPSDEYMEFVPKITIEVYPVVEDSYNIGVDYSQQEREINGTLYDYSVWYEDSYGEKQGLWEHYVNGYIYERYVYKDNYYNGLHEEFAGDNNGKTKEAYYQYSYDDIDQVYRSWLEGSYILWHDNGNKKSEGQFSKGNKTGEWKEYHDDETLASKGSYEDDSMEGSWEYYHKNGKIESKGSYENGKQVDLWIYYNEDGSIDYKWNYTTQQYVD
ncbi:MucBP domain-containing protein, partial [Schnuerera sp.]|uniref:MucBP domain-containing protein n=1 Tax=Schnuerera sp. TaxID=2794844 RepID=UPI002C7533CC